MRRWRWVLAALAVLVVVVVGTTVYANHVLSERVSAGLQQQLGLAEAPAVRVGDPLLLVHAAQGRIPTLRVHVDVPASSGVPATADLVLRDVRFPRSEVLGSHGTVTVGSGTITVRVQQAALQQLAASRFPGVDLTVTVDPDGIHVRLSESVLGLDVGGGATIQVEPAPGGVTLVASSIDLPAPLDTVAKDALGSGVHVALPLPPGATVTGITTGHGVLKVTASFENLQLKE